MREACDFGVERVARRSLHDERPRRRGQAPAKGFAGLDLLDIDFAVEGILDGAIAGAAADIALQRGAEVLPLRLVQRRAGQDHAGGAEAALKRLGVEKGLLHRDAGPASPPSPSMVVTA